MTAQFVDDLIKQAEQLGVEESRGRPKQASLRRAVSAAYYALFHEIIENAVSSILSNADAAGPIGARLSRTIPHVAVKRASRWVLPTRLGGNTPGAIELMVADFANTTPAALTDVCRRLVLLQQERTRADYDLSSSFSRADVRRLVGDAKTAISEFRGLPPSDHRTVFLLGCLFGEHLTRNT